MPCMLPTLEVRDERIALIFILRRVSVPMNHARGATARLDAWACWRSRLIIQNHAGAGAERATSANLLKQD